MATRDVQFFSPEAEANVRRRRALAQQLAKQGEQTPNEVVSGIVVKKSPVESLAKALQTGLGGYQEGLADQVQTEDANKRQELLSQALATYGQDPNAAAQMLMASPATSDLGTNILFDETKRKRDLEDMDKRMAMQMALLQQRGALDSSNWERDAALKRELANIKASGGTSIDPLTGMATPKPAKLTESQGKAGNYVLRIQNAEKTLNDPNMIAALTSSEQKLRDNVPLVGNYLVSPEYQQARTAAQEFVNAVNRRDSGAAVPESEVQSAIKRYIDVPGDSPEVKAAKAQARQVVRQGFEVEAGPFFQNYNNMFGQNNQGSLPVPQGGLGMPENIDQPISLNQNIRGLPQDSDVSPLIARQAAMNGARPLNTGGRIAVNPTTGERMINRGRGWEPYNGQ